MPLIPPKPIPLQPERGGIQNLTADMDKLVAPEERTVPQVQTPDLSVKAQKRGGDYGVVAGAQDAVGGLVKGLALLPDTALNLALRKAENMQGLERGTYTRDYFDRVLRSGSYEEAEPLALGLLSIGRGEDLGTGSGIGNVIERTTEFAALAIPFASALNSMAKASKASKAVRAGVGADTGTAQMSAFVGPSQTVGGLPRAAVNPVTGKAQGQFAATTVPGKLKEMLLAPYRAAPGTFGGAGRTEIGFGAASGLGAGIEQEVYGTSGLTGGLIAPFAAPFAAGAVSKLWNSSPSRWIASKVKGGTSGVVDDMRASKRIAEEGTSGVATEKASEAARQQVQVLLNRAKNDPRSVEAMNVNKLIQAEFGQYFPDGVVPFSVAEELKHPLTTKVSRQALVRAGEEAVEADTQRVDEILGVIQNYYDETLPLKIGLGPREGSATTVINALRDDVDTTISGLKNEEGELISELENVVPGFTQADRYNTGSSIRLEIEKARQFARDAATKKADDLGINKDDQVGAAGDFQTFARQVSDEFLPAMGEKSITAGMLPQTVRTIITKGKDPTFRLSFQDWKNVRESLTSEISSLYNVGDLNRGGKLKAFADMWDNFASKTSPALARPSQIGAARGQDVLDYVNWYRANVAGPFENNIVLTARQRAGGSREMPIYQTAEENVANQFLNNVQGVRTFKQILGEDTAAMGNLQRAFLDRANRSVVNTDGTVNQTKLGSFIDDNDQVISELGLTSTFDDFARTEQQLAGRMAELSLRSDQIGRNKVVKLLNQLEADNISQDKLFTALLDRTDTSAISRARQMAERQGQGDAFRKVMMDSIENKVFAGRVDQDNFRTNPSALKKYMANNRNRRMMDAIFGKEHTDNIQLIADFADRVNMVFPKDKDGYPIVDGLKGSGIDTFIDKIESTVGTSIPGASARFIGVQEGRLGPRQALGYFAARAANSGMSARYEAVLNEALTNPAFARQMMKQADRNLIPDGQVALPLAGPRSAATDFFFQRGVPASVILGTQQLTGGLDTPIETEEVTEVVAPAPTQAQPVTPQFQYPVPQDDPNQNMRPFTLNPPTTGLASSPAPAPAPAPQGIAATQQQQPTANFEELFPFDSTGQAIQRRRSGIGSLV